MADPRESGRHEIFPILGQLDAELTEMHVPEILRFVNELIPRTTLVPSVNLVDMDGHPVIGVPALRGQWYVNRNTTHISLGEEWTRNDRGVATIVKDGEGLSTLVVLEQYFDRIQGNQILERPIRFGSSQNSILGGLVRDGVVDLVADCEGFGFIPPQDLPKVLDRMNGMPDLFGGLLKSWVAWEVGN